MNEIDARRIGPVVLVILIIPAFLPLCAQLALAGPGDDWQLSILVKDLDTPPCFEDELTLVPAISHHFRDERFACLDSIRHVLTCGIQRNLQGRGGRFHVVVGVTPKAK
jgi:hypothetical protein